METSKDGAVLSDGILAVSNSLAPTSSLMDSPFCAGTYLIVPLIICRPQLIEVLEHQQTEILDLIKGYLSLLTQTSDDDPLLIKKLFDTPCQCAEFPEFRGARHPIDTTEGSERVPFAIQLQLQKVVIIDNLFSFAEALSNELDNLLRRLQSFKIPGTWRRQLGSIVDEFAEPLIRTMAHWLKQAPNIYIFSLFGTLLDVRGSDLVPALERNHDILVAFDECIRVFISQPHPDLPTDDPQPLFTPIDFIFHGAGRFAEALSSALWPNPTRDRFVQYLTPRARNRHMDICALIILALKANRNALGGELMSLVMFAESLGTLFSGCMHPILLEALPMTNPLGGTQGIHETFEMYRFIKDRCHNSSRHASPNSTQHANPTPIAPMASDPTAAHQNRHIHLNIEGPSKDHKVKTCASCLTACYCSVECQKDDWKKGRYAHKPACAILSKMMKLYKEAHKRGDIPSDPDRIFDSIPKEDGMKILDYLIQKIIDVSAYPACGTEDLQVSIR